MARLGNIRKPVYWIPAQAPAHADATVTFLDSSILIQSNKQETTAFHDIQMPNLQESDSTNARAFTLSHKHQFYSFQVVALLFRPLFRNTPSGFGLLPHSSIDFLELRVIALQDKAPCRHCPLQPKYFWYHFVSDSLSDNLMISNIN